MAGDLTPGRTGEPEPLLGKPRSEPDSRVFRWRFGIAYVALAVLAGVGIGIAAVLVQRPDAAPGAPWSSWQPTGRTGTYPAQIAEYVSSRYRLPSGKALVAVLSGPPEVQDVRVRNVAIQNDPQGNRDDISVVQIGDNSVMYALCGLGAQCSIPEGQPSEERHQLLRREALELALYTFKYGDVASVITLLPPRPPEEGQSETISTALFFQKGDFRRELAQPLRRTLLAAEPPQVAEISSLEGPTIDRLTRPHLFRYDFTQAPDGSAVLVLAPVTG